MANIKKIKGTIAILTGGGDVPGLNPALRGVVCRALRADYRVIGLRRGWGGITDFNAYDKNADNSACFLELDEPTVTRAARQGGTFLHTSRTKPSATKKDAVPAHYVDKYKDQIDDPNVKTIDLTNEVINNLNTLGVDYLIPVGGDDTLSYGVRLHKEGVPVVAIPKTMDNDVPGTDYCIGFSTCVNRTISLVNDMRTAVGSHERFLVVEVLGRNAGFTALLPTIAGAADRCVIPEFKFDPDKLCSLLMEDRLKNPSNYAVVLVSEGAMMEGEDITYANAVTDAYGHAKLGGIGDRVADALKRITPKYNHGKTVNMMSQRLGYVVRCGEPDLVDSVVPMVWGNMALDLIEKNETGRLVVLRNGKYDHIDIKVVTATKKSVDLDHYNIERLRPNYEDVLGKTMFLL